MSVVRSRGSKIREYIVSRVSDHPTNIGKVTAKRFGISRQAINKHMRRLVDEGILSESGNTRNRVYSLAPLARRTWMYPITRNLAEDVVWTNDIRPALQPLPDNVMRIWHHGFTEMFNNAIDHSEGNLIHVEVVKTARNTEMTILDNGIGIFRKIQKAMDLLDERHAVLELAKGKFTTDPKNHTGEGIFFTSRMFDLYQILSGGTFFSHSFGESEDWILEQKGPEAGTFVSMQLSNHTARTTKKIFDEFTTNDGDYGFNKTVVPVMLAQYGDDNLISRSQAKRLLSRVDLFKVVILDFNNVPAIGQAFADEIFRVFANLHPDIDLIPVKANSEVQRLITRARTTKID